jgi:hypothetical protein
MHAFAPLVAVLPDVDETHRRVEAVEHDERQREVIQNAPQSVAVEVVALVIEVRRFDRESVVDPQGDVRDGEEGDEFTAWLRSPRFDGVRAAAEGVDYPGCLNEDLDELKGRERDDG